MTQYSQPRKKATKEHLKTGVASGIIFGIFMAIFSIFTMGIAHALLVGVIAGVMFGLIIGVFTGMMSKKMAGKLPLLPGEEIVKEGPANHFVKGESVGGWLTVTNQRLHFTSHKINVQVHNLSLPLHEIAGAETSATAGIVPNGLLIKTASGQKERFVVNGRAAWVNALGQVKGLRV